LAESVYRLYTTSKIEYVFISRIVLLLYLILLSILGIIIGWTLGFYTRNDELYTFLLLLFLQSLSNIGFDVALWQSLNNFLLETNKAERFCKFLLKSSNQINPGPLPIMLKGPDPILALPPIIENPFITIDGDVFSKQAAKYQFKLFYFYQDIKQKI